MSNLLQFLTDLAITPQQQERFTHNSADVIAAAGLPASYQAALGDRTAVTAVFADELRARELTAVMGSSCFSDPGPDPEPNPDPGPDDEPASAWLPAMFG